MPDEWPIVSEIWIGSVLFFAVMVAGLIGNAAGWW
jgi:hypothetical protein